MRSFIGIDLGSTTTKAVLMDEDGQVMGRGITNSRSNYDTACMVAKQEALINTRFTLFRRGLSGVGEQKIDPLDTAGIKPAAPTAYWGWGDMPDQYGRGWDGDDGESPKPKRPSRPLADLPPILPWWGPNRR